LMASESALKTAQIRLTWLTAIHSRFIRNRLADAKTRGTLGSSPQEDGNCLCVNEMWEGTASVANSWRIWTHGASMTNL